MELSAGQTILLKDTRERAKVVRELDGGQWLVEAAMDHERFPVHEDNIDPILAAAAQPNKAVDQGSTHADIRLHPGSDGPAVELAFTPAGELNYNVALLNHSTEKLLFSARLRSAKGQQWERQGLLGAVVGTELGYFYRDLLNENAEVELQVSRQAELGTDSKQDRVVKLKPKLFYKNTKTVTWFTEEVVVFTAFAKAKTTKPASVPPAVDRERPLPTPSTAPIAHHTPVVRSYSVLAAAEFPTELDLHLDKLVDDPETVAPRGALEFQLENLREYLDAAIRLGVERVFIIHGTGTGALRNGVHRILNKMGDIEGFKQEYHPKYGHGATEVILR